MSEYLPDEILVNIFLRLPAKSLSEFQLVCKLWYSLINDPNFISGYTQFTIKNANTSQLIMRHYDIPKNLEIFELYNDHADSFSVFKEIDFPLLRQRGPFQLIGLCCGLVSFHGFPVKGVPRCLVIWNPSLQSCVRILAKYFANIYKEPFYGFGFDPKSIDHKIVRVVFREAHVVPNKSPPSFMVDVFALKVGDWRDITATAVPPCVFYDKTPHVYLNGALHWLGHRKKSGVPYTRQVVLAVFDVSEEVFKQFNIPDEVQTHDIAYEKTQKLFVGVFDQTLVLMHYYTQWYNSPSYDGCCIWMMKEYGVEDSWTKQFKIDLRLGLGKMAGLRKNGEVLLVTRYNGELVSYDTKIRKFRKLNTFCSDWSIYLDTYMESLALLKRVNGVSPMPRSCTATASEMVHCVGIRGVDKTNKGKESIEE